MKQVKNLTALILTVLLVFSMVAVVPVTVSAADDEPVEPTEFEEISTVEDLYMINFDLAGNYKLMNDIDLSEDTAQGGDWDFGGRGWEPIGSNGIYSGSTPFTGTFDGNGFEITGLQIRVNSLPSGTGTSYVGLFANNAGTIKNLTVSGSISASAQTYYVGAVAGYNSGVIENCANVASVSASYARYAGGITGYTANESQITRCKNTSDVYCGYGSYRENVYSGGISGYSEGTVSECYNSGNISSRAYGNYSSSQKYYAYSSGITYGGTIANCYNTGTISATIEYNSSGYIIVGGISAGTGTISNCYNTGTATKAISYGTVTNCYFLSGSGADTTGAKSLTNAQMKIERIYAGFDFDNVWVLDKNSEYPYPQLQNNRQTHSVVGIEICSLPDKVTYVEGEEFDSTGLEVVTVYENGTKKAIEDYQVSGFESVKGERIITVTFGDFSETFTVHIYELGDANLDGRINVRDVTAIQRHIADLEKIDDEQLAVADANGDGVVTIDDATLLQMFLAEYDVILGKE